MTLDVLQARMRTAHAAFCEAVDGLPDERLERDAAVGVWSVRDVAAHLADWNDEIALAAEHLLGGPAPPHHPIVSDEAFNQTHAALHLTEPWAAARSRLTATVERAIELAGRLESRLEEPADHPWNNRGTIRDLFHGVCGHQEEHIAELRAWRAGR